MKMKLAEYDLVGVGIIKKWYINSKTAATQGSIVAHMTDTAPLIFHFKWKILHLRQRHSARWLGKKLKVRSLWLPKKINIVESLYAVGFTKNMAFLSPKIKLVRVLVAIVSNSYSIISLTPNGANNAIGYVEYFILEAFSREMKWKSMPLCSKIYRSIGGEIFISDVKTSIFKNSWSGCNICVRSVRKFRMNKGWNGGRSSKWHISRTLRMSRLLFYQIGKNINVCRFDFLQLQVIKWHYKQFTRSRGINVRQLFVLLFIV